jgi:hypothetical protein
LGQSGIAHTLPTGLSGLGLLVPPNVDQRHNLHQ